MGLGTREGFTMATAGWDRVCSPAGLPPGQLPSHYRQGQTSQDDHGLGHSTALTLCAPRLCAWLLPKAAHGRTLWPPPQPPGIT